MIELSHTELEVLETYGKGLRDQEVADKLDKPVWTVKTHKKNIFQKLGVNSTHEMIIYLVSLKTGKPFKLDEIRRQGIAAVLSLILTLAISVDITTNKSRTRGISGNARTQLRRQTKRENELLITW
ncbi:MAG: LuxR C-terminal-related transcriptional regulator [Prevotella sp.]|jgi:DNA-binding CsgD family transcriptional regulator|nr:LuxR C-terminal-related transcriptional regulator [Prevotella sp.]